jgi:hypothetical protein
MERRSDMTQAQGSFTVQSWDESTYEELAGEAKLNRAHVTFGYTGDLQGQSTSDSLMCYRDNGTAVYTGLERITGQLGGRSGSFVVLASGAYADGEAKTTWQVVEGSGTGDLAGLRGQGSAAAASGPCGTYTLQYDLG